MTAYLHKNWCGLGDRIVVHPKGRPTTTDKSIIDDTPHKEEALAAAEALYGQPFEAKHIDIVAAGPRAMRPLRHHSNRVFHFHPETLELLNTFPIL